MIFYLFSVLATREAIDHKVLFSSAFYTHALIVALRFGVRTREMGLAWSHGGNIGFGGDRRLYFLYRYCESLQALR